MARRKKPNLFQYQTIPGGSRGGVSRANQRMSWGKITAMARGPVSYSRSKYAPKKYY